MRTIHEDEENICMRRGTFLVLWDLLTRTLDNANSCREVAAGKYDVLFSLDEAERRALHSLTGAIQRGGIEVMSNELPDLIAEEKRRIMSRPS
ncbi:MAG: hypothetical protein JWO13_3157 [Acidobacteriales bacterium]|nr:hypothetical protein [Terriglobales bacterium]